MKNTEKIRILTEMRELIETGGEQFMCHAYARARGLSKHEITDAMMNEVGLFEPKGERTWVTIGSWYHPNDKATRLQKIDEAINKFKSNTMNKNEIKAQMQSIEENIKKETERLNALRLEMDKPEKPTLEEMRKGETFWLHHSGGVLSNKNGNRQDSYLSRERAEKEKLRIKLSVIADYLNGGLFEPASSWYCVVLDCGKVQVSPYFSTHSGGIAFKTREHVELAMTYFTNDELIKMLR